MGHRSPVISSGKCLTPAGGRNICWAQMNQPPNTIPTCFGGLDSSLSDYDSARAVVIPLPYDGTATWRTGARDGPAAIIEASQALELFDEQLLFSPCKVGIATLEPLEPDARGPEYQVAAVSRHLAPVIRDGKFPVALGGEHSLTLGCVEAFGEASAPDEPLSVLQIDAHADLRDVYQNSRFSHACVMRRVLEKCPVVQVGVRSFSEEEHEFMVQNGLETFTMDRIRSDPGWIFKVVEALSGRVYLTIDLDGLDPSICPGVGTPEPGGLDWHQVLDLLGALFSSRRVVGADVVECSPLPGHHSSEYLAARLVYKLVAQRFKPSSGA